MRILVAVASDALLNMPEVEERVEKDLALMIRRPGHISDKDPITFQYSLTLQCTAVVSNPFPPISIIIIPEEETTLCQGDLEEMAGYLRWFLPKNLSSLEVVLGANVVRIPSS